MNDLIGQKIVDHASGVITFEAVGAESIRATELIAVSKNSKGMERYPETATVELHCSSVAVTAAKRATK